MKLLLVLLIIALSPILAQDVPQSPTAPAPIATTTSAAKKGNFGFSKGSLLFSASTGIMTASGSLIDTDRAYNDTLATQSQLGAISNKTQPFVTPFTYKPSNSTSGGIEYGITDRIGLGIAIMQFSVKANGQNRYPNYINMGTAGNPNYARGTDQTSYSIPGKYLMYSGTNVMALASYHFIPKFQIDPYVHVKMGGGSFLSSSHRDLYDDDKYFLKTGDFIGMSKIIGGGAGVNFYILEELGLKFEVEHYRQFLASPNFSTRTLNTTHFQIGFVFDLTKLQK